MFICVYPWLQIFARIRTDLHRSSLGRLVSEPFGELLSSWEIQLKADINQDGVVNLLDFQGDLDWSIDKLFG